MEKSAQKRDMLDKLRESVNIGGAAAEKFFDPKFKEVMEALREKDDAIRGIAAGTEIDDFGDKSSLKQLYKSAQSNFNRREYMKCVSNLSHFHQKLSSVVALIKKLEFKVEEVHNEFLFRDLEDEDRDRIKSLKTRFADRQLASLKKEAGIADFWHNATTTRGRALGMWEKRYPKRSKELKQNTSKFLERTKHALSVTLASMQEMSNHRADRAVDDYMKSANVIVKEYNAYHALFKEYYQKNIEGFLDTMDMFKKEEATESKNAPSAGGSEDNSSPEEGSRDLEYYENKYNAGESGATPSSESFKGEVQPDPFKDGVVSETPEPSTQKMVRPTSSEPASSDESSQTLITGLKPKSTPTPASSTTEVSLRDMSPASSVKPAGPATDKVGPPSMPPSTPTVIPGSPRAPTFRGLFGPSSVSEQEEEKARRTLMGLGPLTEPPDTEVNTVRTHNEFYNSLTKLANAEPFVLISTIRKYAQLIKETDPETSIKLLKVCNSFKG